MSHLCDGHLAIDVADLFAAVKDQDESEDADSAPIVDDKQLKLIVRQQVKAESKSQLTDDLVVAAYMEHGSSRKAAESLTKAGHRIHHSTVARIVQKAEQTLRGESSESIVRTVASQRRDGKKKIQNRPEAKDWA